MSVSTTRRPTATRRWRHAAAIAAVAAVTAPLAAGAAVADDPTDADRRLHDVTGTVVYVISDPEEHVQDGAEHADEHTDGHDHAASTVEAYADVDGSLVDLSAVQAPLSGAEPTPADALPSGSTVVVTLEADADLDRDDVVALAAGDVATAPGAAEAPVAEPGTTAAPTATAAPGAVTPEPTGAPTADAATGPVEVVAATPTATADLAATADLGGVHQLVVLPVTWSGGAAAPVAALQTAAAGTERYWEAQSGGRVDIRTSVRPAQTIGAPATCDGQALMSAALAVNPGIAPGPTTHVVVHHPAIASCGFAGRATIGGGSIWLNGYSDTYVLAHELGHNFGLGHANTLTCTSGANRVPLTAGAVGCTAREYGDNTDVMGQGRDMQQPGNISSGFAAHLGWASVSDVTSAAPGTYDLAPLSQLSGHRGLLVRTPQGAVYTDYRPAVGADARHEPGWAGVQSRLIVVDPVYRYPTSYLLDLQPGTPTFAPPNLPVGGSWAVPGVDVVLTTSSTGASARVAVGASGGTAQVQRYVTKVYADLFGRAPDAGGLTAWTNALVGGTPRSAVAASITSSDEYRNKLVAATYRTYLGRNPDVGGAAAWLGALKRGATVQDIEAGFLASQEYYNHSGRTDTGWVTRLYRHVLGREATAQEIRGWTSALDRGVSRRQVAMGFLNSTEHLTTVVDGYYVDLLGRRIDASGRRSWVSAIQRGTRVESIIGGIIASREYFSKV